MTVGLKHDEKLFESIMSHTFRVSTVPVSRHDAFMRHAFVQNDNSEHKKKENWGVVSSTLSPQKEWNVRSTMLYFYEWLKY